ncbi:MAG: DivIVA domain-containing protein [Myxococcota bacterium]|nr:DivIVA domain-containing protein [Myxococcota bacterium]
MRVTPLDIIQKQFAPSRRGVDTEEVVAFLDEVRESMEEILKDNQELRQTIANREAEINDLRGAESGIKETLSLARQMSDELTRKARRESDLVVGEARLEAQRILMSVADERRELQSEIVQLQASRLRLLADLRAVLDTHARILDSYDSSLAAR